MAGWDPFARLGFEIELLAPEGSSRAVLADVLAPSGDAPTPAFHVDTEPTLVPGRSVFHHLSRGFEVPDGAGAWRCRLVDDLTIVDDLDPSSPPAPGWYRVISDDRRLLSLARRLCDPAATAATVLAPLASAFGSVVEARPDGRFRVDDRDGSTVAMAAPQPGMRERVAEIITPPLDADPQDHVVALEALLAPARHEGFTVPAEAAVHVHLDAEPFRSAAAIRTLVRCFGPGRADLRAAVGTNPRCRRLGPLPGELVEGVEAPGFADRPWPEVEAWLRTLPLTKYADVNLTNLVARTAGKDTVELRILPGAITGEEIVGGVAVLARALAATR